MDSVLARFFRYGAAAAGAGGITYSRSWILAPVWKNHLSKIFSNGVNLTLKALLVQTVKVGGPEVQEVFLSVHIFILICALRVISAHMLDACCGIWRDLAFPCFARDNFEFSLFKFITMTQHLTSIWWTLDILIVLYNIVNSLGFRTFPTLSIVCSWKLT